MIPSTAVPGRLAKLRFPHEFRNPALVEQALTHRSAGRPNNERLEFLGDSLVGMLVAELLFESHARADEDMAALEGQARAAGLEVVERTLQLHNGSNLVGWRIALRKA